MLTRLSALLTERERVVARSVLQLEASALDLERSVIDESGDFLRCRFVAVEDRHCSFALDFGRGEHDRRFNFFIGLGAEVANYELLATAGDALELQLDVQKFLCSTVEVESHCRNGEVTKERYRASQLVVDGQPLALWYKRGGVGLFSRHTVQHRQYAPWIVAGA
ncbi:MAG TPA: hypothetical protein VJU61_01365 [Polyangiaceae bacterium]|nr:hypothetical protein [Polyangiaceae bacterium]